jgi:hypothetical protein
VVSIESERGIGRVKSERTVIMLDIVCLWHGERRIKGRKCERVECVALGSPVRLSRSGGGGTGAAHVEVRTRRVSLGELAVAKRARDAGLGAPEGSVVITVGVVGEDE